MSENDKPMFPCGDNLAKLRTPDCERGEFALPLPFEGENELIVEWEKIEGFEISDDFAYTWGYRLKHTKDGAHYLGRFLYNGEEMQPVTQSSYDGCEHFYECRFDIHGNDSFGSRQDFDSEEGFNVTLLRRFLPKSGKFKAQTPSTEITAIRFGNKGDYKLYWENSGGSNWTLKVDDTKELTSEEIQAMSWEKFNFNFFDNTVNWEHSYLPTDWWDNGGYDE